MAYFRCEHGSRYFPFGRGGREKLLGGLSSALSGDALLRLQSCPMRSLPLVAEPELQDSQPTAHHIDDLREAAEHQCGAGCSHDPAPEALGGSFVAPISVREPQSESAQAYRALADDVIAELFRTQSEAVLVRPGNL